MHAAQAVYSAYLLSGYRDEHEQFDYGEEGQFQP